METPLTLVHSDRSPSPATPLVRRLPQRLLERLELLDAEQLQVIEICAIAIARGAVGRAS